MTDPTAIYADDPAENDYLDAYQELVNTGQAWRMEGSVGREAMSLIRARVIGLGELGHHDYWGNYVPSRYEVAPGTDGAAEYARF